MQNSAGGSGAGQPAESAGAPTPSADAIEYIADLILELRSLAERAETPTLAGILELAYREARLEVERRSWQPR